ncbi:MAG: FAD-binding oxidoreductase [Flavobacteriales bacterium]
MSNFHTLTVVDIRKETSDSVSVAFEVDAKDSAAFSYAPGQYLTLRFTINGEEVRRSYSLCSSPFSGEKMRVAVKIVQGGKVSTYMNSVLKVGDKVDSLTPMGNFTISLKSDNQKHYVGFAAGSGITPVYSLIKAILEKEPKSKFTLIYSNKGSETTIFNKELEELHNANANRFKVVHVWSRQETGDPVLNGRLNAERTASIISKFDLKSADEFFICGPEEMIMNVSKSLKNSGIKKEAVHFELFTTPVLMASTESSVSGETFSGDSQVTVIMDGIETKFKLAGNGVNILDAAIDAGADAPYSCKGAVCCTCKAKVQEGKAVMDMNYALTDKEVADGYILTCQAHPLTDKLVVDYDVA